MPAVFLDFSSGPSERSRVYDGLVHVSDWFPTLANLAGIPSSSLPSGLDGRSIADHLSPARTSSHVALCDGDSSEQCLLAQSVGPRDGVLLEMWGPYDTPFMEQLEAYRLGDFKLINGTVRDANYYWESKWGYFLNISKPLWVTYGVEVFTRILEAVFGVSRCDSSRATITYKILYVSERLPSNHSSLVCMLYLFVVSRFFWRIRWRQERLR